MASWSGGPNETHEADDYGSAEAIRVVRLAASAVIAVVAGIATFLAGVGGATPLPSAYVLPVAGFVTVGLFVAFYVDLTAGQN